MLYLKNSPHVMTMNVELGFVPYDKEDAGLQPFALNWDVRQDSILMNQFRVPPKK